MAFQLLLQANNLDYKVLNTAPTPIRSCFISSERIEQELGLGTIKIYHLSYIDPNSALTFLQTMDLLPTTSGYGFWTYGGGGTNNGGSGGNGGFGSGNGGNGGFGGGSGGNRYSAPAGSFAKSVGGMSVGQLANSYANIGLPEPMQGLGGGSWEAEAMAAAEPAEAAVSAAPMAAITAAITAAATEADFFPQPKPEQSV